MKRILIVDSDVSTCLELSDLLGEFGFETAVADNNDRAISILQTATPLPNVILLDEDLPNRGGWSLKDTLAAHPEYKSIPVLLMSSLASRTAGIAAAQRMENIIVSLLN